MREEAQALRDSEPDPAQGDGSLWPWLLDAAGGNAPRLLLAGQGALAQCQQAHRAWQAQQREAHALLHVQALAELAPGPATPTSELADLSLPPERAWGLLPGVQRLDLHEGSLQLSLCLGPVLHMLREQTMEADAIWLGPCDADPDELARLVARHCRRGTRLVAPQLSQPLRKALQQQGLRQAPGPAETAQRLPPDATARESAALSPPHASAPGPAPALVTLAAQAPLADAGWCALFEPHWTPRRRREPTAWTGGAPGRVTVIGAGLAGAACAASLARRGWQVTVLDRQGAAGGASGLPVGLMAPHVSPDDSLLSRLSRAGVRATLAEADRRLTRGRDWAPSGVLQRCPEDEPSTLPRPWPEAGHAWSCSADQAPLDGTWDTSGLWHAAGAWIRPAELVKAWLAEPGIALQTGRAVARLERGPAGTWLARSEAGDILAESELMLVAAAHESAALLASCPAPPGGQGQTAARLVLQPIRGQVSWALHAPGDVLPPVPVNGHGSFAPRFPSAQGPAWLLGATFDRDDTCTRPRPADHAAVLAKLERLLPETAASLAPRFAADEVQAWAGVRCSWRDHLPLVGPLAAEWPGLWLCTGFGSRGLSYSAVCAELVAAWLHGEPLPLSARLAQALQASRALGR